MNMTDRLAAAPISWGVCEVPDWGVQLPPERVLEEMASLGFVQTELGSAGYLPENPTQLNALLSNYGLALLGAFIPLVVHDELEASVTRKQATQAAAMLRDAGATYFITAAVTTWDWDPKVPLTQSEWQRAYETLDWVEELCAEHGLVQAVHPHLQTVIETAEEVQRILDHTTAGFTFDTGHLQIGGYDPLAFLDSHMDRIRHVHLKDVRMAAAASVVAGEASIMEGVQNGMFCNLGQGDVPIAQSIARLEDNGYANWYVIEQDAAITGEVPAPNEGPIKDVSASVDFLRGLPLNG